MQVELLIENRDAWRKSSTRCGKTSAARRRQTLHRLCIRRRIRRRACGRDRASAWQCFRPISTLAARRASGSCAPPTTLSGLRGLAGATLQHVHDVVTRAHVVIVDLSRRAFLVGGLVIVCAEDTKPRAVFVIDKKLPAISPEAFVPGPVPLMTRCFGKQRSRGQALRLHPVILLAIADRAIGRKAVRNAAVLRVPCGVHGRAEEKTSAAHAVGIDTMAIQKHEQFGPFSEMTRLEPP